MDPEATAVICGGKSMTYRELDERSSAGAVSAQQGIGPEDVVGLLLKRTLDYPVCVLAVSKSGGAFLPIDSEIPPERVAYILKDSSAKVLLVSPELIIRHMADESIIVIPTDIELEPAPSRDKLQAGKPGLYHIHVWIHRPAQGRAD